MADIRQGTRRDAILHSVGANATHGMRRTNADKRRAVTRLLEDAEWAAWSDREIARRCGVSQPFVGSMRESHTDNGYQYEPRTFIHPKTGQPTQMSTANIGRGAPQPAPMSMPALEPANDNGAGAASRLAAFSGDNEWYTPARYVDMARATGPLSLLRPKRRLRPRRTPCVYRLFLLALGSPRDALIHL
nr:hypothetical protein [Fulvimarina manganoxydans]